MPWTDLLHAIAQAQCCMVSINEHMLLIYEGAHLLQSGVENL
jgi:hypothetical protein